MKLVSSTVPEDARELPAWLERQIAGLELADLVAELEAIHGRLEKPAKLDEVCAGEMPQVLSRGLAALSPLQLRTLLTQPRLLLQLQEKVFIDGGAYWRSVATTPEHQQATDHTWKSIVSTIAARESLDSKSRPVPRGDGRKKQWSFFVAAVSVAAAVVVAIWTNADRQPQGWGWDRPGALTAELSGPQYLNHLADSADEWFNKRPETKDALATRLREFRHGCDTLITAPHRQLSEADRTWLVERCRVWSGKFEEQLTSVESGGDVLKVRAEADAMVEKLIDALRTRSKQAA